MRKLAFVFAGQGAQYPGMCEELYTRFDEVEKIFKYADSVMGKKISDICFYGKEKDLKKTINTQPAIFIMSVAIFNILKKYDIHPDVVAGYSLGEYSALYAAGVLDLFNGLFLVQKRAEAMDKVSNNDELGMGVIAGKNICNLYDHINSYKGVYIANYNTSSQVSVSGRKDEIHKLFESVKALGEYTTLELPVAGAFHTPYMEKASEEFLHSIEIARISKNEIPIVINLNGELLKSDADIKEIETKQIVSPVMWEKSVNTMLDMGVDTFIELGPKRVLSKYIKDISKSIKKDVNVLNVENMESLIEIITFIKKEKENDK